MSLPVVYRRRVQHDLAAAFDWYEEQRPGLGDEFLSAVQLVFRTIANYPELFACVTGEVRRAFMTRFPFAIFYMAEASRVVVLRVLHTARDPGIWPRPRRGTR